MPMRAYKVVGPVGNPPLIEACSLGARLPFEAKRKGPVVAGMRAELERAVRRLRAGEDELLDATLVSPSIVAENAPDTENVLILNVECPAAFAGSCQRGLRFERLYERPSNPSLPGAEHQHLYTLAPLAGGFCHWRPGRTLASFDWTRLPSWTETSTYVSELWWAMRRSEVELGPPAEATEPLALKLELRAGQTNASRLVKKAINATVAAFQSHRGALDARVPMALGAQIGTRPEAVADLLLAGERAVLGSTKLVVLRRPAVQWQPDDDRLVAFALLLRPQEGSGWSMRGTLSIAEPASLSRVSQAAPRHSRMGGDGCALRSI
jgi:hypothetical protein